MSSASSPSSSMHGIEKARVATRISGNCGTRSSGGGGRCALYWSYISLRMRLLRRVEDHRHVGRPVGLVEAVGELPQHRRIAIDRARRLAVPVGQRRQPVIGAEDVARPVDEIEVRLGLGRRSVRHGRGGLAGWRNEESRHESSNMGDAFDLGQSRSCFNALDDGSRQRSCHGVSIISSLSFARNRSSGPRPHASSDQERLSGPMARPPMLTANARASGSPERPRA